jgi:hypothetical protein
MHPVHLKLAGPLQAHKKYWAQRQKYLRVLRLGGPKLRAMTLPSPLSPPEAARRRCRFVLPKSGEVIRKPGQISIMPQAALKQLQGPGQVLPAGQTECRKGLDENDFGQAGSLSLRPLRCAQVSPESPGTQSFMRPASFAAREN